MANPYTVLGDRHSKMHARKKTLRRIHDHLLKPGPDHVSVIGPKMIGKSTLLRHLVDDFPIAESSYLAAVYWDLREEPVSGDRDFEAKLCSLVKTALKAVDAEAAVLFGTSENLKDDFQGVLRELEEKDHRILVVLDEFDAVLTTAELTRNLWDWLRAQARLKSFRLVTGSRLPLQELCKSEDAASSDFWNIFFDTPLLIGPFEDSEWDSLIEPFGANGRCITDDGVQKIRSFTGGVPVLTSLLLNRLHEAGFESIDADAVSNVCESISDNWPSCIADLWDDCGNLREFLVRLAEEPVLLQQIGRKKFKELKNRGFVVEAGNHMASSCELMLNYAREEGSVMADLARLFDEPEQFRRNVPKVLEMRLSRLADFEGELLNYVRQAVTDLYSYPGTAIAKLREIAPIARKAVISNVFTEVDSRGRNLVPMAWVRRWQETKTRYPDFESSAEHNDFVLAPEKWWDQCSLFQAMTGSQKCEALSPTISKSTAIILSNLSEIGAGAGGHPEEYKFRFEFAAALCFEAVVLCENLARELQG